MISPSKVLPEDKNDKVSSPPENEKQVLPEMDVICPEMIENEGNSIDLNNKLTE